MTNNKEKIIRVGSRKSELALIQTKHVIARLQKLYPNKKFEIHTMSTIGDRVLNISLPKIGEKSLFTRDLEDALRNGGVDFVVHSLKDLPTALPAGMAIGAVLEREDARDAIVLREEYKGLTIETLPEGSVIGTSSLRRTAQIRRQYPHLRVCDIRGNLNTRLAKLDAADSKFAGIVLAQAGLVRMGWNSRISQVLEPSDLLYAVGQGALAVECRANDDEVLAMLQRLMCLPTTCLILAERSFLKTLGGGCSAPVAVCSTLNGSICDPNGNANANADDMANDVDDIAGLSLVGAVWSLDGVTELRDNLNCSLEVDSKKRPIARTDLNNDNGNGRDDNDNDNDDDDDDADEDRDSNDQPPTKRARDSNSNSPQLGSRQSPPVFNDDPTVEDITSSFNVRELIDKHIDLAKKCPVVGVGVAVGVGVDAQSFNANANNNNTNNNNNNNVSSTFGQRGGGDADTPANHCPLKIDVGQDFMGQCPFVNNETKVSLAKAGICPVTNSAMHVTNAPAPAATTTLPANNTNANANANDDEVDHVAPSTSKCPFSNLHAKTNGDAPKETATHAKCPFLQKTVQMFDYADEEKPRPHQVPSLIEDMDKLFCGLYQHACYNRQLYVKSERLGQQLAEELIKKGALDIMKRAQAEIHSKA